ncbi:alpha/beta fold hydrolase [Bdellovibrio sp. HCB290]|uniref:alpha/beta fold hydrolase n=1 Tax=Bdellovibrio sp. HCB290 TaxID=3394356 RepID=UPI0039B51F08
MKFAIGLALTAVFFGSASLAAGVRCEHVFDEAAFLKQDWMDRQELQSQNLSPKASYMKSLRDQTNLGSMVRYFDKELDTWVYHTAKKTFNDKGEIPWVDPDAQAVVVYFHGSGTAVGGGGNGTHLLNSLIDHKISGIAFDMPFHSKGPVSNAFQNSDYFMRWIDKIVTKAKAAGKPVYLVGHSFGPDVIAEYMFRHPHDVDGAVLMSPASFNAELKTWYWEHTDKMRFGGKYIPVSTDGGKWSTNMSSQFQWNKTRGKKDPTVENPDLKTLVIIGDREEYVPGPTGGRHHLPTGKNTYDVEAALREHLKNFDYYPVPGAGHYLFDAKDASGKSLLTNLIAKHIGTYTENTSRQKEVSRQEYLQTKMVSDKFFRKWAVDTYGDGIWKFINHLPNETAVKSMISNYEAYEAQVRAELYNDILNTEQTNPSFYRENQKLIDVARKNGQVTDALIERYFIKMQGAE